MKTGHERNQESLNYLFSSKQSIKSSNYKWQPRHLDKEDVKIYYDLIKNLTIVNPRDSTYELPVSAYSYLYKFCEAVGLESEKNDLQKWFKKTTSETINGNDDYFEVDTDIIDTIEFAMEDYLNDTVQSSRRLIKSSSVIKERDLGYNDYFKGYKKSDNPYLKDSESIQYIEWETGWLMAEEDDIDQTNYAKYGSHFYTN